MKTYFHKVQYYETDKMGITHHSNYVRFMEEARTDFLEQIGWSYKKLEESGIISPVTSIQCEYKNPSTYSDIIKIEVGIEEIKGARLKIRYNMTNQNGLTVCEARSEHCFLNSAGRLIRIQKDCPEFYAALNSFLQKAEA